MPTNGKKKDSLLFAILDVISVLINFSFLKLCSALVTVTTHFVNSRSKASEHCIRVNFAKSSPLISKNGRFC